MKRKMYKAVIRTKDDDLVSCVVHQSKWKTVYTPGKWVTPKKGTLLFVFSTKKRAIEFRSKPQFLTHEVWKCEVRNTKSMDKLCWFSHPSDFTIWWSRINTKLHPGISCRAPEGTRGCEAVRLIERVK